VVEQLARGALDEERAMAWVLSLSAVLPLLAGLTYARIRERVPPVAREVRILAVARRHWGLLARFAVPQLVVACGAGLCIPFLGLYFQDRFDRPPGTVGELYAGWQLLATVGFMLSPLLSRRLGFVWGMVVVELGSIPFFLTLAFTRSYPLAVLAFLLRGALMNSAGPIHKHFMMEVSPEGTRELQVALNALAWGLAWVAGPWLGGLLLDRSGDDYALLMLTTVGFYLTASVTTIVLLGRLDPRRGGAAAEEPRPA
jgi:predicted MFS family arabinose efflux permease